MHGIVLRSYKTAFSYLLIILSELMTVPVFMYKLLLICWYEQLKGVHHQLRLNIVASFSGVIKLLLCYCWCDIISGWCGMILLIPSVYTITLSSGIVWRPSCSSDHCWTYSFAGPSMHYNNGFKLHPNQATGKLRGQFVDKTVLAVKHDSNYQISWNMNSHVIWLRFKRVFFHSRSAGSADSATHAV